MTTYLADSAETRYVDGPDGERFAYRRFGTRGDPPARDAHAPGIIDH
ncbi:hypothetical protein JCM4814A_00290 [Streptomyces phaeofaciens JCM 4814]|uniref:Uncharacterized protein n=1 Tax=Streptomyces phaeofaciens TaxID=68254 RepID=A0A918HQZ8_9ACTN|nr:hypothetical protein GCM10010226_88050 [Streptomyces phaeofaciens]